MTESKIERPEPRWWAEPITVEEFEAFAPRKLELVNGYLFGEEAVQARLDLLVLLLKNCGIQEAAFLSPEDDWREATEHAFMKSFD